MKKLVILSALGTSLGMIFLAACGTNSSQIGSATTCVGTGCLLTTTTTTTGTGSFTSGDTESWTPVNQTILNEYVGYTVGTPTTPASSFYVNIALAPTAGASPENYSGTLTIQFVDDSGTVHNGTFMNGTGTESYRGYTQSVNGAVGGDYRIFFEDPLGAVILLLTPITGTDTATTMTGTLYFRNFNSTAPNPLYDGAYDGNTYFPPGNVFCWMIDTGPYDCQMWTIPPTNGANGGQLYNLLGTIPTVNVTNALGI